MIAPGPTSRFAALVLGAWLAIFSPAALIIRAAQPPHPLVIGVLLPGEVTAAASVRQGAQIGLEHAQQRATAATLAFRGLPGQWGTDGDQAATLALDDEAAALITPPEGVAAHQILQVAGRTRLPVVSLCPDSSVTGAGVPWAARIVPTTADEMRAIVKGCTSNALLRPGCRWAALVSSARAGREAAHDLRAAAQAMGVSLEDCVAVCTNTWNAQLQALLDSRPGAILVWTEPLIAGGLVRELRQAGFSGLLAGPTRLASDSFVQNAGRAAEGMLAPGIALEPRADVRTRAWFEEAYVTRFGAKPDLIATMAHDAVLLLVHLSINSDQTELYRKFPIQADVTGASGPLHFDRSGNRVMPLELMICKNGRFLRLAAASALNLTQSELVIPP